MNKQLSLSILATILLSSASMADELKQNINLGFVNTSGNTETLNLNAKYDANIITTGYNNQELKTLFDASAFTSENNKVQDNEEYKANLGLEQAIGDGWLGYASVNWLKNKFLDLDHKASFGVGAGKELYKNGPHLLTAKLGLAHNLERYRSNQPNRDFTSLNEYVEYNNQLNKVSNFFLKASASENVDDFSNDFEVLGTIGVNFAVAERVNVTLSEEVRYDKVHAPGIKRKDTKSVVTVGYHF